MHVKEINDLITGNAIILNNMQTITKLDFEKKVHSEAQKVHRKFLSLGQFWPIQVCRQEARKKLINQYKISK